MVRTLAATALAAALFVQGAPPAAAADWPTTEDCLLYEAAFKAVIGEEGPSERHRRVAFTTRERPLDVGPGEQRLSAPLNLKGCIALNQRIYAAGLTFVGRPAFGFRMPGTPYYEHFSLASTQDGKTHITYWTSPVSGMNVTLTKGPDGSWTAETPDDWVLVAEDRR